MAQVLAPGVAQAVLSGLYQSQPWALVWHFAFDAQTGTWSQTSLQQLVNSLQVAWGTSAAPLCAVPVSLHSVVATDIGTATPAVATNTTVVPGTRSSAIIDNAATCAMMNFHINARYRGGHPRSYLPWGAISDLANEFTWTTTFQAAANTAIANMINAVRASIGPVNGAQVSQVCPRYNYSVLNDPIHQKYVRQRTSLKAVNVVASYAINPTLGIQRRRLHA